MHSYTHVTIKRVSFIWIKTNRKGKRGTSACLNLDSRLLQFSSSLAYRLGQGGGSLGEKGVGGVREVEKGSGREAGFPMWREEGEIGKIIQHCAKSYNRNSAKSQEPTKIG